MRCFAQEVGWAAVELVFVGCLRRSRERRYVRRIIIVVWRQRAGLSVGARADKAGEKHTCIARFMLETVYSWHNECVREAEKLRSGGDAYPGK